MIGGAEISATVLAGAREMLSTRRNDGDSAKKARIRAKHPEAKGEVKSKGERRNREIGNRDRRSEIAEAEGARCPDYRSDSPISDSDFRFPWPSI